MTYDILATGSGGNAVVINGEILIDCGVPYKTLEKSGYVKSLKLVLLTHRHSDHFNPATVRRFHQERPALRFGCCEWMVAPLIEAGVDRHAIHILYPGFFSSYARFAVKPVELVHDVKNCGYTICLFDDASGMLFYATDTGTLDGINAKDYDLYLLEANHTRAELEARAAEKQANGEFSYEYRAAKYHLSREQALEWLAQNAGPNSKYQFLHQHKETKI